MATRRRQLGGVDRLPSGRYRVRLTDPATGTRVSAGTYTSKADAEKAFALAVAAQDRGTWIAPRTTLTLAAYSTQWLESRLTGKGDRLRPRVRELYEGQLRRHILPTLGRASLAKLRPTTVRSWYAALVDHGPGAVTAAKCYRLLRAILNTAVEDGLIAVNPCTIRGAGAERSPERAIPTLTQVFELAEAVDRRYRALVLLAAFGGLRRGELFGLRRRHVDLTRGIVTVEAQRQQLAHGEIIVGPPKSEAGRRIVAVPPQALVALRAHLDRWTEPGEDAWIFTGAKGGPLRDAVWQHQWDIARRSVGLPDLHFHDLRHVAATLPPPPGLGSRRSCIASGTRRPRPPSATSTPRRSETEPSPRPSPSSSKRLPANEPRCTLPSRSPFGAVGAFQARRLTRDELMLCTLCRGGRHHEQHV